jgi:hypothetical protein
MDVLTLLRSKNRCLLRFEQASLRFLGETEGAAVASVENSLPKLERSRSRILKALGMFDRKLDTAIGSLADEARTEAFLADVRAEAAETDRIVAGLLKLDESVVARIQECRERIAIELAASEKSKQLVGKFKSEWAGTSGEEIDRKL